MIETILLPQYQLLGLYGVWQQARGCSRISSVGLLTSPVSLKNSSDMAINLIPEGIEQETARVVEQEEFTEMERSTELLLRGGGFGQYSSTAILKNCTRIVCYARTIPHYRITGLVLEYDLGSQLKRSKLLGQISLAEPLEEMIYLDGSEILTKVEINTVKPHGHSQPDSCIMRLKFWTNLGRQISWGRETSFYRVKEFDIKETSVLRWDFNKRYDVFRILNA